MESESLESSDELGEMLANAVVAISNRSVVRKMLLKLTSRNLYNDIEMIFKGNVWKPKGNFIRRLLHLVCKLCEVSAWPP